MIDLIFWCLVIVSLGLQKITIAALRKFKIYQQIYSLTPQNHQQKKWVPSFGGIGIIFSLVIGVFVYGPPSPTTAWCIIATLAFALIGFVDDMKSIFQKINKGLTVKEKLVLQVIVSISLVALFHFFISPIHSIGLVVLYVFLFVATTNATNLTDGVDGLLSTVMLVSLIGMSIILAKFNVLNLYWPLIKAAIAALLGFLMVNWNPAKIFMGDTGSLALGGLLSALAIASHPMAIIWVGALYIAEAASVVIQVVWFKHTQKRVFLMSPLHHHFELLGFSEVQIVMLFASIQALFISLVIAII
jgi:phospho-N-acetylmuramoyl-pentapeptide-transferase